MISALVQKMKPGNSTPSLFSNEDAFQAVENDI